MLLGLEPGTLSVPRSAGECTLLSFSENCITEIQIDIIAEIEPGKHTSRKDFKRSVCQQLTVELVGERQSYHGVCAPT